MGTAYRGSCSKSASLPNLQDDHGEKNNRHDHSRYERNIESSILLLGDVPVYAMIVQDDGVSHIRRVPPLRKIMLEQENVINDERGA